MHFFSPVDKMPLVEIIRGEKTSPETVARAIDVVQQIRKTPIVVNDSRGFYTSRVYGTLLMEAAALLEEGVDPQTIERAATMAGFPAPPLAMHDEVSLTLSQKIRRAAEEAAARDGVELPDMPGLAVVERMVEEFGRKGQGRRRRVLRLPRGREEAAVAGPARALHQAGRRGAVRRHPGPVPVPDGPGDRTLLRRGRHRLGRGRQHRLDHGHRLPAAARWRRAVHAGLRRSRPGTGLRGFVARAVELASAYGERFAPPTYVVELAEKGERFPA